MDINSNQRIKQTNCGQQISATALWLHGIAAIMPDCLSGDRVSTTLSVATADSAAINIDVPVQIRPRYLVYVSPWDIKIAEETTDN